MAKKNIKEDVQGGGQLNYRSYRTQDDSTEVPQWDLTDSEQEPIKNESVELEEADINYKGTPKEGDKFIKQPKPEGEPPGPPLPSDPSAPYKFQAENPPPEPRASERPASTIFKGATLDRLSTAELEKQREADVFRKRIRDIELKKLGIKVPKAPAKKKGKGFDPIIEELDEVDGPELTPMNRKTRRDLSKQLQQPETPAGLVAQDQSKRTAEKYLQATDPNYATKKNLRQAEQNRLDMLANLRKQKESGEIEECEMDESVPPGMPKSIINKVEQRYGKDNPKSYQTLWAIHKKMKDENISPDIMEEAVASLPLEDVDPKQLKMGIATEKEHTNDPAIAEEIALAHLKEDPHYYSKLKGAGLEEGEYFTPDSEEAPLEPAKKISGAPPSPKMGQPTKLGGGKSNLPPEIQGPQDVLGKPTSPSGMKLKGAETNTPKTKEELLAALKKLQTANLVKSIKKGELNEWDNASQARPIQGNHSEAERAEHELKKLLDDVGGASVNMTDTQMSPESLIVSVDGQEQLDKQFHFIVTCSATGQYNEYMYQSDDDGSKPMETEEGVDFETIKRDVLEFVNSIKELVGTQETEVEPSDSGLDEVMPGHKPLHHPRPAEKSKSPNITAEQKSATVRLLNQMIETRQNKSIQSLKENMEKMATLLKG